MNRDAKSYESVVGGIAIQIEQCVEELVRSAEKIRPSSGEDSTAYTGEVLHHVTVLGKLSQLLSGAAIESEWATENPKHRKRPSEQPDSPDSCDCEG
jgi:hypothetical protein